MICYTDITLIDIHRLGKKFKWKPPENCSKCGGKLWGHGFVGSCFEGYTDILYLKRYRCTNCGCIITMRPLSHFSRYQSSTKDIYQTLKTRLFSYRWPPWCTRQRGGHWLRKFCYKCLLDGVDSCLFQLKKYFVQLENFLN